MVLFENCKLGKSPPLKYDGVEQQLTSNKSGLKLSQCALNWKMKRQMECLLSDRQELLTSPCLCLCLFVFTNRSFLQTRLFLSFFPLALCRGGQACSAPFSSEEFQIYTSQLISHQGSSRHRPHVLSLALYGLLYLEDFVNQIYRV